ncbi:uncharacterized protein LOC142224551 [Haematobia irritans]|uniref:uncharacterized protein LOC142224551 n=1 Tax=Haematobia irritans TaxID=7368 RepID=UPI003F4FE412
MNSKLLKMLILRFVVFLIHVGLVGICILLTTAKGQQEIYGDIFPSSRPDHNLFYNVQHREMLKCYRDVPAQYFQTREDDFLTGNSSIATYLRIEVCCEGYRENVKLREPKCIPDCSKVSSNNCRHGFCRSPQLCECFDGFVANSEGNCVHTCPVSCENGHCLLDGTCICKLGYRLDPETKKFCIPECYHIPCGLNQHCTAPGRCECMTGYQWLDSLNSCQPICQPHCGFGHCVAPNKCECFPGYIKRSGRNICEAECYINCSNGFCESPYKCQCYHGFTYDPISQTCLPYCRDSCEHGVCIAPGVCRCFEGYYLWDNVCKPICTSVCGTYGICVKPNVCACRPSHQHCMGGGKCSLDGKCECPSGMVHFIDRCVYSANIHRMLISSDERIDFDKSFKEEFETLIGRYFQFKYAYRSHTASHLGPLRLYPLKHRHTPGSLQTPLSQSSPQSGKHDVLSSNDIRKKIIMNILQIIFLILYTKSVVNERLYSDYIDDISQDEIRIRPSPEWRHPNFHKPVPKEKSKRKNKPTHFSPEGLCVRNYYKKKAAEELKNPQKEYKPYGNRWHGPIKYGGEQFKPKQQSIRNTKHRDITAVERKLHKCYKWVRSNDVKRYEMPTVMQRNEEEDAALIEICCPHYAPINLMGNTLCRPYCQSCSNGKCVAPDVCECHDGFVQNDGKQCVFTCPISCLNGRCNLLTGACLCNPGYTLDETGKYCRPVCRAGCGHNPLHNCTAPDVCGCISGFSLTDNDCQPIVKSSWIRRH